jgi:hypothetical protein
VLQTAQARHFGVLCTTFFDTTGRYDNTLLRLTPSVSIYLPAMLETVKRRTKTQQ